MQSARLLILILLILPLLGQAQERESGTLESFAPLTVQNAAGTFRLIAGEIKISLLAPGWTELGRQWRGEKTIQIEQAGRSLHLNQPKAPAAIAELKYQSEQLALIGRREIVETRVARVERVKSCTYVGYCAQCGYSMGFDGKTSYSCSSGYRSDCDGHETVLFEDTEDLAKVHVDFFLPGEASPRASAHFAPRWLTRQSTPVQRVTACR